MWLVFVDDTKQKGLRKGMGQLLALAAVAFSEDVVATYAERVVDIYDAHGVPASTELKWSSRKGSWFKGAAGATVLTDVRVQCLEAAADLGARAVVVVFDLGRTSLQGQAAESRVLQYLFERVTMMMSAPDDRAVMICDKPGGGHKDEDNWIGRTLELTSSGTDYVKPGSIVIPLLTAPSHHHPHLQLADLVGGAITAAVAGVQYGIDLIPKLQPLLHTNNWGAVAGTGLKVFPDDLLNVYHWVLGCDSYMRGATGVTLPITRYDYSTDDGMGFIGNFKSKQYSKRFGGDGQDDT